jgi:hypothetical protein
MRISRFRSSILFIILVSLASIPVGVNTTAEITTPEFNFSISEEITGVPYVWQEVNGFCFPSALSMVLQSMGIDLSLYDILAASGSSFSMVSISVDEAMMFYPGVMVRQIPWFEFFTDLYGIEMEFYMDSGTEYGWNALQIFDTWDTEFTDYADSVLNTPRNVMRNSIDTGYPLAISVDTYYLPVEDWDITRDYVGPMEPGGVGHAIVIVGYNDTAQRVQVFDPGVGLLGNNYGYPDDGRWNYSMSYSTLDQSWRGCGYTTFRLSNGTGPVADLEERLASYITQRMQGNRSAYFEGYENYFYLSTGANAFRGMAFDMNLAPIRDYCYHYLEVDKPTAIRLLGHNLEVMMTMQYLAFRGALDSLPNLLPSLDLQAFLEEAAEALPHMDTLSHNDSITSGITVKTRDTLLYNTFFGMADSFESSHDLDAAIREYSDELDEISTHLVAVADAWQAAGQALSNELERAQTLPNGNLIVVIGGGASILIIGVIIVVWRRKPTQIE